MGKVRLSEKVVLVLLPIEVDAIKAGSRSCHHGVCQQSSMPSKRCAIKAICHQSRVP